MRDLRENDGNRAEQTRKPEPDPGQKQAQGQGSGKKRWLSGKKRWLSGAGTGIAAGLLMGLTYVGIGYMVLTAVFPVVMVTAEWWMGRGTDPREGGQ